MLHTRYAIDVSHRQHLHLAYNSYRGSIIGSWCRHTSALRTHVVLVIMYSILYALLLDNVVDNFTHKMFMHDFNAK